MTFDPRPFCTCGGGLDGGWADVRAHQVYCVSHEVKRAVAQARREALLEAAKVARGQGEAAEDDGLYNEGHREAAQEIERAIRKLAGEP